MNLICYYTAWRVMLKMAKVVLKNVYKIYSDDVVAVNNVDITAENFIQYFLFF